MEFSWSEHEAWIAQFDILGFKNRIRESNQSSFLRVFKASLDEAIYKLDQDKKEFEETIEIILYADTFIIYTIQDNNSMPHGVLATSENFLVSCIRNRIPVRGAISYGELILGQRNRIIMGKAFLECYEYGEDQNWIGLILTPSASLKLKSLGLNPKRFGYINRDIPLRKYSIFDDNIYAYRFSHGSSNFKCPLLPILNEMKMKAPNAEKVKYLNTIEFIEKYYAIHKSVNPSISG